MSSNTPYPEGFDPDPQVTGAVSLSPDKHLLIHVLKHYSCLRLLNGAELGKSKELGSPGQYSKGLESPLAINFALGASTKHKVSN